MLSSCFCNLELVSGEEWLDMQTIGIEDRFNYWFAEDRRFKFRDSKETWLQWEDDKTGTLMDIRDRYVKLQCLRTIKNNTEKFS